MKFILLILLIITLIAAISTVAIVHKIETDYVELTKDKHNDTDE